jgi:hypothetical protein
MLSSQHPVSCYSVHLAILTNLSACFPAMSAFLAILPFFYPTILPSWQAGLSRHLILHPIFLPYYCLAVLPSGNPEWVRVFPLKVLYFNMHGYVQHSMRLIPFNVLQEQFRTTLVYKVM